MTVLTPARPMKGESDARAFLEIAKDPKALEAALAIIDKRRETANKAIAEARALIKEANQLETSAADRETALDARDAELTRRLAKFSDDEASREAATQLAEQAARDREAALDAKEAEINARQAAIDDAMRQARASMNSAGGH